MKIAFITNIRIPSERAHGVYIMKMGEAFVKLSHHFNLIVSKRYNEIKEEPFGFYKIKVTFPITRIFCFDFGIFHKIFPKAIYIIRTIIYGFLLIFNKDIKKADVIYTHDIFSTLWLSFFKKNIIYEIHDYPRSKKWLFKIYLNSVKGIITTNQWKKRKLNDDYKINEDKIIVLPNAVNPDEFVDLPDKNKIRKEYQVPEEKIIFGYIGRFSTIGMEKGLNFMLKAFKEASAINEYIYLIIAGGDNKEIEKLKITIDNLNLNNLVKLLPFIPYSQIKNYYALADVFLLPYPNVEHYQYFMSPMKLFEYVACKKPIIASDLNSIREIFSDGEVSYFEPGDVNQLKNKIIELAESAEKRKNLAVKALAKIKNKDWSCRAGQIIQFIKTRTDANIAN